MGGLVRCSGIWAVAPPPPYVAPDSGDKAIGFIGLWLGRDSKALRALGFCLESSPERTYGDDVALILEQNL